MKVERYRTAALFLQAVEPYLLEAEAENNLILGIARAYAGGAAHPGSAAYFAAVRDSDIRICAFSTLPTKLGITQGTGARSVALLAQDVHEACPAVQDIVGPEPTARAFVEHFVSLRRTRVVHHMAQRIHALTTLSSLDRTAPGHLRPADQRDLELAMQWVKAFAADVGDAHGDPQALVAGLIASGQLYLWEDNRPVSMAAWTGKTPNGVRVNLVYTPPAERNHGYATACVSALSRHLLALGNRFCCLYTDAANPTSNAIYHRIGYRPVTEAAMYTLAT